jgi:hypothetical protein
MFTTSSQFLEAHVRLVFAVERMAYVAERFEESSRGPIKAITVCLYVWSAFAASLTLATLINIWKVIF